MSRTLDAIIDEDGGIRLLKPVHLSRARRALVTILDDQPGLERDLDADYRDMALKEAREMDALGLAEAKIRTVL